MAECSLKKKQSKVAEFLKADDFYREAHRLIFEAMLELFNKNEAVDLVTVTEVLRKNDKLEAVGGIAYITSLANSVPTAANINYHGKIVEEKALLRGLINSATHIASMGYEDTEAVADIIDKAEKMILEVSERKMSGDFVPIKSIIFDVAKLNNYMLLKGGITGLATGFKDLDKITSGLQPSDLIF